MDKTIRISNEIHKKLVSLGSKEDTFNSIILRLIRASEGVKGNK